MNVVFEDSVGAQARQWFKDVLASSKIDFNKAIASRVTVRVVSEPSVPGHNDYACTSAIPGGWLIEIRRGLDDPASPLVANIPGPARLFFMETVAHELAHVLIGQTKADPARLCPLFVRAGLTGTIVIGTQADWNISTRPSVVRFQWEDRIEEAVAETVKDAALPDRRVYDNRTNWRLPEANFAALMTALLGAGGEFTDDFETDSSSRYLTSGDSEVVYSGGRVHSAGGTAQLTPRAAHFGDNLHVQVEVRASDPATAIVGILVGDPVGGGSGTILFALVNGDVFTQGVIEPASFGAHTFLDLQVNGATTTASVKDAAQAVLYSRTFETPEMAAFQPSLLLFDNAEVERWSAVGDPVIVTYTTVPDHTIPGQRTTLSWQSSAISPAFPYRPPLIGDPAPGHPWDPRPWYYDVYFDSLRQLRVWVYDVSDVWANRDRDAYLEVWGMPFEDFYAPDPDGFEGVDFQSLGQVGARGQEDLVAYTDGTVPIDDTPFTQANVAWPRGLIGGEYLDEWPGLGGWLSISTGSIVYGDLGVTDEITLGPDEHAIHRLQAADDIINPGRWKPGWDPSNPEGDPWLTVPRWYVNSNPERAGDTTFSTHVIPPPPDVPIYLAITVILDANGLVEPDSRAPLSELSYVWQKGQEEAARSLWPKVVFVIPDRVIPGHTTVEVQTAHSELPDWPYVPPFVAASAGAPAALRLR